MATLIKQAHVLGLAVDSAALIDAEGIGDVLIEEGRIAAIAPTLSALPTNVNIIEAKGQFLGPGLVDLYSQSGEPGHESRETHHSLRQAAAAGGFTRVGLLPNTQPVVDNAGAIAALEATNLSTAQTAQTTWTAQRGHPIKLMPWAAITLNTQGTQLTELAELAEAGALGFTDAQPLTHPVLLRRLLEYTQPLQKPVALWPCSPKLVGSGVAREGHDSLRLGLSGVSPLAETTVLATLLECVAEIPSLVHIMRVSTARSVTLIRQAKAEGLPISASVPWHHLMFDTHDLDRYDPNLRHDPPLGTPRDRQALIAGVTDGVIDAIAIDHSPYTYEEKTVAFDTAPPGAIGLELALPMLWQTFVASGQWSPTQLWQALSMRPLQCLGLTPNSLQVQGNAELTLFDPEAIWQATPENLHSLANNTPWAHQEIQGKVVQVWH